MLGLTHQNGNLRVVVSILASIIQVRTAANDTPIIDNHDLAVNVAELNSSA